MFWKFNTRYKNGMWKRGLYYISVVILFFLFLNIMTIQRNFANLESENYIDDPGGSSVNSLQKTNFKIRQKRTEEKGHPPKSLRYLFENKLRKLLDIMESNLDNTVSYRLSQDIPIEKYFPDRLLYCDDILNITDMTYLASGWTKAVYKATFKGSSVAIKTVDVKGQDVSTCMDSGLSQAACYVQAAKKIVKEIVVLQALAGENVLKVLGFCLPRNADDNLWVAMVTELGEAVDLIKLLQMPWEDRLRICLDITRIVHFMSRTPYGSMSMNDFRRQQFVLVDGALKLSDVDDTGFENPTCKAKSDCDVVFSSANFTQSTRCVHGKCIDFNEKKNIYNAGRLFVTFLLPHGAPQLLQPIVDKVVDGYNNLTLSSEQLLRLMNKITELYQSGWYLNRTKPDQFISIYKRIEQSDLPGLHDYRCPMSISMATCTLSVFDVQQAEEVCNSDPECKGFVVARQKTWTGRNLVHLKNMISQFSFNPNTTLYIKPS